MEGKDPRILKKFQYYRKIKAKKLLYRYQNFASFYIFSTKYLFFINKNIDHYNKMKSHKIDSHFMKL